MKKQHKNSSRSSHGKTWISHVVSRKHFALRALAVVFAVSISAIALLNTAQALTASSYCTRYTEKSQITACEDGFKGADCSIYSVTHDQNHVDICNQAAKAKEAAGPDNGSTGSGSTGNSGTGNGTGTGSNSGSGSGSTPGSGSGQSDNKVDSNSKEKAAQATARKNPDSVPDNNYGQFVGGDAELHPLDVSKAAGNSNPAIIFINGGGWHTDDGTGAKVTGKANERGYTTFVAHYRLGSGGIYYMLDDVMRAIRHVRNNAGMYGIDPNRIAIWGDSAGGSLVTRAGGTGKSGAALVVGWSAPTNAYTGLFKSGESFAIGMDHSTCAPTDPKKINDVLDQLNGGPGDGQSGAGSTDYNAPDGSALGVATKVLTIAKEAQSASKSAEAISKKMETDEGNQQLSQNARRLAAKKFLECLDNFNSASPALFASPLSPPMFLAGYTEDWLVDPGQAYQMRDKLRSLGIASEALILPGKKHLGYEEEMVKPSLDFVDKFLHPANAPS